MKYFFLIILFCAGACDNYIPKPKAMLRLEYPKESYEGIKEGDCPFYFLKNEKTELVRKGCNMQIHYRSMKATIYINYRPIRNDLKALLQDAQKLTYEHVIKANHISEKLYEDNKHKVYGMLYSINGNSASQTQFYVTDSINHFLLGALYFYTEPNYDSIYPAVKYIDRDIRKIMESLRWR